MKEPPTNPLRFFGGTAGALAPFGLFMAGVAWLGLSGAPDERGFWPILVAALVSSLALVKDRHRWAETGVDGMSRPIVMIMVMAWILAGILGALLSASGLVGALAWGAEELGVAGAGYAVAAFLICAVVSTSTGTSLGTVILCAPLLYPPAGGLGTDPVILMGAVLGGATFGDNISPVSDTTIASALSQGAEMGRVVRSRLRYALPAAAVALGAFAVLGASPRVALPEPAAGYGSAAAAAMPSPAGLPMLAVPVLVVGLLLRRRHLLEGLLVGIAAAAALGLGLGLLAPTDILHIDVEQFGARGLVVDGIEKALGVSVFTFFLMGMVATIEAAGVVERVVQGAMGRTRSLPSAERWTCGAVSAVTFLTTHPTVAILTVGDFSRRLGRRFGIRAERRANLLDTTVCSWPFIVPWFIPAILAASLTSEGPKYGLPRLSALQVGLANAHSWALLAMVILAITVGYGRGEAAPRGEGGAESPAGEGE